MFMIVQYVTGFLLGPGRLGSSFVEKGSKAPRRYFLAQDYEHGIER
jgi:hypothetical protein